MSDLLHTPVDAMPISRPLTYNDTVLSLGSCFSENIGRRLAYWAYRIRINPFGTLYNPISILQGLCRLGQARPFSSSELFEYNGLFHSPMHHGRFSAKTSEETLALINSSYESALECYRQCSALLITWGSTRIYSNAEGHVLANCHKLPSKILHSRDLDLDECYSLWSPFLSHLLTNRPDLRIILTVSPIRHLGDGSVANNRSKSRLLLLSEALCQINPRQIFYFPAYELMMDELRDYRFYAEDMTHPSPLAIRLISERFESVALDAAECEIRQEIKAFRRFEAHRPLQSASGHSHKVEEYRHRLEIRYPMIRLNQLDV